MQSLFPTHLCGSSANWELGLRRAAVGRHGHRARTTASWPRRDLRCDAWGKTQKLDRLWDYDGTCVKPTTLEELQLLHRRSFGHRNARTYMVVLYSPDSPACQAAEQQVERLACGLLHEPSLAVAALDISSKEAAQFAQRILGVTSLPAVLLYPEASPGFLRYADPDFTAEGLLGAINKARQRSLRDAPEYELIEAYTPIGLTGQRAQSAAAATALAEARLTSSSQQQAQQQWWQQQQQSGVRPTPLATGGAGYWSPGKAVFWGFVVVFSVFGYCWDRWLADQWEAWCLQRRQAARQRGRKFTVQENVEDFMQLLMNKKIAEAAAAGDWEEEVGLGQRAKGMAEQRGASINGSGNSGSSSSGGRGTGSRSWTPEGPLVPAEWQALPVDGRGGSRGVDGSEARFSAPSQPAAAKSGDG